MWDSAGGLPSGPVPAAQVRPSPVGRRAVLAGLGIGALSVGSLSLWRPAEARTFETGTGQQERISLSDGTRVLLDSESKFVIRFTANERAADLIFGRVNFRVAADHSRPFAVNLGAQRVFVQDCEFDICRDGDKLSIILIRGNGALRGDVPQDQSTLHAGERLVYLGDRTLLLDKPDLTPLLAWQSGQAIFEDSTLAEAVSEMNRYSRVKLTIADPKIAKLPISGIYRVGDNRTFAHSVSKLLPINVKDMNDRIVLVAEEQGTSSP